ncbi:MATE family efflux transporter [Oscillibacter sp. 1-3]|uniref:MATE family efflux transporter n=1 Tax=Oscillibacter sp. 1-3 TaxID=1235797 RepID=UPI0012DBF94D|nr:MATE family efflux transporter [Oscillibacter sp. 1-3]MCI9511466.1 MATE family efflux transporter [Oscillibacter sp.]
MIRLQSESRAMVRVILTLAWPTMLEQISQSAVQYIDTAMVGALGTQATAAVGATSTVGWLVFNSITAFGVGFLGIIAKACGAQDARMARRAAAQSALAVLVIGILSTVLVTSLSGVIPVWMQVEPRIRPTASRYFLILYLPLLPRTASIIFGTALRAAGDTRTPMKVGVWVNCINVVLNFLLIYPTRTAVLFGRAVTVPGAGMGVVGAAAASAAAFTWGGIRITWALWRHPVISPRGQTLRPDPLILRPCLRVALPNMLQRFGTSLGYVAFAAMINSLGEAATAAHTIANTVESAFYIPGYGMQTAAATLTGNAYGAGDQKRMKALTAMFLPVEVCLMCVTGGALFATAPLLMGIFSSSGEVVTLGATVLRMVAVSEPLYGVSIIVEGMMMGVGKTKTPFVYNIIGMWCVRIVGTFLCIRLLGLGLVAAWGCMIAHNVLLFALYLISFVRGTWNPLRERDPRQTERSG